MRYYGTGTFAAGTARRRARSAAGGFTLIELLVVIGVISILVTILLPSLSAVKSMARKVLCATMLHGYQLATEVYISENNGVMLDSYKHLDPVVGIPRYWGTPILPERIARCPDDYSTESAGRLGRFPQYNDVRVSIGCNENMLSCSARPTSVGPMAFWVYRDSLVGQTAKLMTWADWQNNPYTDPAQMAVVKPVQGGMGSLSFRHGGKVSNAAFLDGHVGEMRAKIALANNGHDLAPGVNWHITGSVPQLYKCYYPFGVGATQTVSEAGSRGNFPDIAFN